jgi:hypothetical protein
MRTFLKAWFLRFLSFGRLREIAIWNKHARPMYVGFLLLLVLCGSAATQYKASSLTSAGYSNAALGFRYKPPSEMQDETESERAAIQARVDSSHTSKRMDLLLSMTSGSDDTAQSWVSLGIETYPRDAFPDLDDVSAEAKMSAWVAGIKSSPGTPRSVVLSGQHFSVSVFGIIAVQIRGLTADREEGIATCEKD